MKVIFLLDNQEFIEISPERLQLRQMADGQAALGYEVVVPLKNEDGSPILKEDGSPELQNGYRPLINYAINLSVPQNNAVTAAEPAKPVKSSGKAKAAAAKRK